MKLHIYKSETETIAALAEFFSNTVNEAIAKKGKCSVVLSGGNSPKQLYELLASEYNQKIDWTKVYFFFGDERAVPFTDKDNNGAMAKRALFDPLEIKDSNIFYIDTDLAPAAAALDYAGRIKVFFEEAPASFDLILLGLGDNAHTASLFPYTTVLTETEATVSAVYLEAANTYRITMTAPLINNATAIAFLVFGTSKAGAVFHVLQYEKNTSLYPAQLVETVNGSIHWFLDEAAASLIKE
jgi:6-phosphogluconolactonase